MAIGRRGIISATLALAASATWPALAQTSGEQAIGDPAAPVTMIEYSSLTCPHCAAFHIDTLPELKKRYIDTGKVRLVLRDFPLDQTALQAAMIAHCAGDGRYAAFIDAMFASQRRWAAAADPVAALEQIALAGGLSREKVRACLADRALGDRVLQARLDGQRQHDIRSTPTFIIGGKSYPGNRTVEEFAAIIDPLLPRS
jgi:protein-disulfide isomerase